MIRYGNVHFAAKVVENSEVTEVEPKTKSQATKKCVAKSFKTQPAHVTSSEQEIPGLRLNYLFSTEYESLERAK